MIQLLISLSFSIFIFRPKISSRDLYSLPLYDYFVSILLKCIPLFRCIHHYRLDYILRFEVLLEPKEVEKNFLGTLFRIQNLLTIASLAASASDSLHFQLGNFSKLIRFGIESTGLRADIWVAI